MLPRSPLKSDNGRVDQDRRQDFGRDFEVRNYGAPTYVINATWDEDAKVWVAVSDDVPGLVAEADDVPQLMNKLKVLIPELLEANGVLPRPAAHSSFPIELLTHRRFVLDATD